MRYEFATLFDRRYLARGLVLYLSLEAHCRDFLLRIFCMDRETEMALRELALPSALVIGLEELEEHDRALVSVKPTRSRTEYYWTATPAICRFALERFPEIEHIVHLDADLEFHADPAPLFDELGEGSVLLTPHRPAPEFSDASEGREESGGRFNVQFELFRRTPDGTAALNWWHERCIEWCYKRWEPTRYGDQKYLDELPVRFGGVRETENLGAGLAPWNVSNHRLERRDGQLFVDDRPLLFHHFQSLELHPATKAARSLARASNAYRLTEGPFPFVWTTGWRLTGDQLDTLWDPYVARLSRATAEVAAVAPGPVKPPPLRPARAAFHVARRHLPLTVRTLYWRMRQTPWTR